MKFSPTLFFIGIVFSLEILIQIFDLALLNFYVKPLIIPAIAFWYFQQTESVDTIFTAALFFCWVGDVLLLLDKMNPWAFIAGVGAFLVAHLLLIFTYRKCKTKSGEGLSISRKIIVSLPVILISAGFTTILFLHAAGLQYIVILYATALTVMVLQAFYRYGFTSPSSFWNVSVGAATFFISDLLLALNKFYQPIWAAGFWIMLTYTAAVFFIVKGTALHPHQSMKR